jgi:hypothetical protein
MTENEPVSAIEADAAIGCRYQRFRDAGGSYEGLWRGGQSRRRARLAHDAPVRGLSDVHASRGGTVRVGRPAGTLGRALAFLFPRKVSERVMYPWPIGDFDNAMDVALDTAMIP